MTVSSSQEAKGLSAFFTRSTGIGLHNIGARLRLYAGSSSCIRVQSKPGFGTRVTLELPWRAIEPQ